MSGAFQHTNRKGDVYHLQAKKGASGKLKYSFSRKLTGDPVARIPDGYEVRELPESGQVLIRKVKPAVILLEEKRLLEDTIRREVDGLLFIVDVEARSLIVYTSDMRPDARVETLRESFALPEGALQQMAAYMMAHAHYMKMMRFTLIDAEQRLFNLDRWCFMGSIDDWYFIEGDQPLAELAGKYVRHLDKESFFELM